MDLKSLCIIPARGGSKRLPRKNLRLLAGKPLIQYTIEAAINSNVFSDVYVSSDNKEILDLAHKLNVSTDERPKHLALDTAKNAEVIYEFLNREEHKNKWDIIVMCLPTCPLRTATHIFEAYHQFLNSDMQKSLIGVTEYDFPLVFALRIDDNMKSAQAVSFENYSEIRTQDCEKLYHPNGSIYMLTVQKFIENKDFFYKDMYVYPMLSEDSVDIDFEYQFLQAESLITYKKL